jgi:extradiol dioxygenase family protein
MAAFHFAFFVHDLDSARRFYGEILGCREGRSTDTWVDFDFFGNQISAHNTGKVTPTANTGRVEDILVPMPHFGAILDWDQFNTIAGRIRAAGMPFILEPSTRYAGQPGEQATMFLLDPSGNALEFKSFKHREHVFTT